MKWAGALMDPRTPWIPVLDLEPRQSSSVSLTASNLNAKTANQSEARRDDPSSEPGRGRPKGQRVNPKAAKGRGLSASRGVDAEAEGQE